MRAHVRLQLQRGLGREEDTLGQSKEEVGFCLFFQSNRLPELTAAGEKIMNHTFTIFITLKGENPNRTLR